MNQPATPSIDLGVLKSRQQATWASGNYSAIGTTLQIVGERLCETIDLRPGARVLDVAGGNGNASLAAARRFARVTATDYVPALVERARARAEAEGQEIDFAVEDAEALSFPDASFDVVLSTFGVMFTADHDRAAAEMMRVCRPGGTIAMANWTPDGFIGQLFKTLGRHLPPPPGARSPALWGTEATIRRMFGTGAEEITLMPRSFTFRYCSPQHFVDVFRNYYGPVLKAFEALGDRAPAFEADLLALIAAHDRATDGTMSVPSEYVEVVIRKA
jgi:ubiquinone/menaquinone biosynthesis C-methylase UbiE